MSDLKAKRLAAGISGSVLCAKIGLSRSRLSLIERGHVCPAPEELARLEAALDELIHLTLWDNIYRVEDAVLDPRGKRSLFGGLDLHKPEILFLGEPEILLIKPPEAAGYET